MKNIETVRHSLSHIMAQAVKEIFPKVKFGIGPNIENGFYYDFDLKDLSLDDLPKIEKRMIEIINKDIKFKKKKLSKVEARKLFKDQPYKLELIKELKEKTVSVYESDGFMDLCKGPHIKSSKEIDPKSFKLHEVAGAYWTGDEKNPMLTRIYGLAFSNKKELKEFLDNEAEAERRDHRRLGQKLELFEINNEVGPGLILWLPKGALLKKIVQDFALNSYLQGGYQLVNSPHIGKLSLWDTSGHTGFYQESMYPSMSMSEKDKTEKDKYQLKPMNCPFHILIYKNKMKSYRDLPVRYAEMGTVYRYEKSGTLHGLTRVRGFTQDDAHIWATPEQLSKEIEGVVKFAFSILSSFGFKDYYVHLATRPSKYVGSLKNWKKATEALEESLRKNKVKYEVEKGDGAFYGPKIDIKVKDSIGRLWQLTTIQVDFNLPERFDMSYIDEKGKKQTPIMIHRALLGSLERFIGVLLEYHAGNLPLWLCPIQVEVIPISQSHEKYAKQIADELESLGIRTELKNEAESVGKKIRNGELQKIPYLLIVGDKEIKSKSVSVRERGKGDLGAVKLSKFLEKVKIEQELKK